MVRQRGLEAAAQRGALDHGQRDRAGVEAAAGGVHAIDAGARVGAQRLAPAAPDRFRKEVQVAAHVVDLRDQRARYPEVDGQPGVLGGAGQRHDLVYQFMVEAGPRLGPQHHPYDASSLLVVGGDLFQVASLGKRMAVRMHELIHCCRPIDEGESEYCGASLIQSLSRPPHASLLRVAMLACRPKTRVHRRVPASLRPGSDDRTRTAWAQGMRTLASLRVSKGAAGIGGALVRMGRPRRADDRRPGGGWTAVVHPQRGARGYWL